MPSCFWAQKLAQLVSSKQFSECCGEAVILGQAGAKALHPRGLTQGCCVCSHSSPHLSSPQWCRHTSGTYHPINSVITYLYPSHACSTSWYFVTQIFFAATMSDGSHPIPFPGLDQGQVQTASLASDEQPQWALQTPTRRLKQLPHHVSRDKQPLNLSTATFSKDVASPWETHNFS